MRWRGPAILAAAAFLLVVPNAHAVDFKVNSKKDRLDANPGDGICATSKDECSLRAAIGEANALPGIDDVMLPKGTFKLTRHADSADDGTNETGDLALLDAVTITGKGPEKTRIKQTAKRSRVLYSAANPEGILPGALVSNLTITGGRAVEGGGGVYAADHLLGLGGVTVRGNMAKLKGAGSRGGGILVGSAAAVSIIDSLVRDNDARGDGLHYTAGGGIWVEGNNGSSISGSRVVGNVAAPNGLGGGIYVGGAIDIDGSEISDNDARSGGGIEYNGGAGGVITSTTISENSAKLGGGVAVTAGGPSTIENSTVSGNALESKHGRGAAFHFFNYVRPDGITLSHLTIAGNGTTGQSSMEFVPNPSHVMMVGSILDGKGPDCHGAGSFDTLSSDVFGDASCGLMSGEGIVADPKLKPLADNRGAVEGQFYPPTHKPKGSSPAVDFVPSGCPPPAFDQLGFERPAGPKCDSGAVELRH